MNEPRDVEQYARTAIINRFDDAYWAATICCSRDYARAYSYHCRARLHNVECGAPLSKEMALRIVRKFPGVTLDWLFLGIAAGYALTLRRLCAIIWNITAGCLTNTKQSIASIVSGDYLPGDGGGLSRSNHQARN